MDYLTNPYNVTADLASLKGIPVEYAQYFKVEDARPSSRSLEMQLDLDGETDGTEDFVARWWPAQDAPE